MTGWRLDPAVIGGVLTAVQAEAAGLDQDLRGTGAAPVDPTEAIMAGVRSSAGLLAPVAVTVEAMLSEQAQALTSIANRIEAGLLGVANATLAYEHGQQDMSAQFQSAAAAAATDGNFSWFDVNGVR